MPAIKEVNVASTSDALSDRRFREVPGPALITLYASAVNAGDTVSLTIGSREICVDAEPNIEISADVVDAARDLIVEEEPVGAGILHLRVVATAAINYLILIEQLPS